ncbi:hypothetical protein AVEN_256532-1 [Araneus ventricosus]|uniref:Uncharacterized protein n=1 Tax=Araneus ventricosus TaxID=182803 RepID=A0A4Y2S0Y6_ARAVE|nr:hypothetical protein AVEN_256532-1 [Araneus ventricosus]
MFSFINVLFLKQHEGYFGTNLVDVSSGQMTRTTPEQAHPSSNFRITTAAGRSTREVRLSAYQATYTADLQSNRVSNLKPSDSEDETMLLGHHNI